MHIVHKAVGGDQGQEKGLLCTPDVAKDLAFALKFASVALDLAQVRAPIRTVDHEVDLRAVVVGVGPGQFRRR